MWDRLANAMASVEETPEKQKAWAEKFRWLLDDWKLVPGTDRGWSWGKR